MLKPYYCATGEVLIYESRSRRRACWAVVRDVTVGAVSMRRRRGAVPLLFNAAGERGRLNQAELRAGFGVVGTEG